MVDKFIINVLSKERNNLRVWENRLSESYRIVSVKDPLEVHFGADSVVVEAYLKRALIVGDLEFPVAKKATLRLLIFFIINFVRVSYVHECLFVIACVDVKFIVVLARRFEVDLQLIAPL